MQATIALRTGHRVTGRLVEHRGGGVVVVQVEDGRRYAGKADRTPAVGAR